MSDQAWPLGSGNRVQDFRYPVILRPGMAAQDVRGLAGGPAGRPCGPPAAPQELADAVEAARKAATSETQAQAAIATAQAVAQERSAIAVALQDFARQRRDYFRQVESELVRLALAIARKVLHREAQMDPLLLSGVVRVAVDQVQAGTRLVLRTCPDQAEAWRQFCARHGEDQRVEVVADGSIENYRCVLQAEAGSTEISLEGQLKEIESGFFDLLDGHAGAEP